MNFTKATNMGIHVMTYLVQNDSKKQNMSIHDLSNRFNVSSSYLSKILAKLSKAKLILSMPGVKGGYRLNKPAASISFYDVIEAVEGTPHSRICLATDSVSCPIQQTLLNAQNAMWKELKMKKLIDLEGI